MRAAQRLSSALLILVGTMTSLGCSGSSVTAPDDPNGASGVGGPFFVEDPESSGLAVLPIAENYDPNSNMGSSTIDGDRGGILRVGRFTLYVPPGAFDGPATVSLMVADPTLLICDLDITPRPVGDFKVPIILEADCKDLVEIAQLSGLTILWMNDEAGKWEKKGETIVDEQNSRVRSGLNHFSTYGVVEGRAGW